MGDKLLARAFELAQNAVKAEQEGQTRTAKDLFRSAIELFKTVLVMPGFIQSSDVRTLIETELKNLQERMASIDKVAHTDKLIEERMKQLNQPADNAAAMRERLDQLKGLNQPLIPLQDIKSRLDALKADGVETSPQGGSSIAPAAKVPTDSVFAGTDWKKGMDPEIADLIEQARDETFM